MSLTGLIGEKVLDTDYSEVQVSSFEKEGAVVGLYFSAHWCPPCRAFTPLLSQWYKKVKSGPNKDNFEIVFLSSDRDENSWKEYFAEMPWKALDFKDRDQKNTLSKTFKVTGIPTLVFVDAKTGSLITADGRSIVGDDPDGKGFPWKPKPFLEMIQEGKFINKEKEEVTWDHFSGKVIGIYFSAHWCGPCRSFTPQLVQTYNKLKEAGKEFEIIFVSSDREEDSMFEYFSTMPWYAIPFGDSRKKALSRRFDVSGIPTLVILNEKGEVITKNGRGAVNLDPEGTEFPWYPKPVVMLSETSAGDINDTASLIWFVPEGKEDDAKQLLEPIAKKHIAKWAEEKTDPELLFYVCNDGQDSSEIRDSLKSFAKLKGENSLMLCIIDIPDQKVYEAGCADLTEDNISSFVSQYLEKKLESRPLR